MDYGKGRYMERCAGGAYDKSIINRIMLRYRPIAPKPAANGGSDSVLPEKKNLFACNKRTKRKYVRGRKKREKIKSDTIVKTLQLLPEKTEQKDSPATYINVRTVQDSSTGLKSFDNMNGLNFSESADQTTSFVMPRKRVLVESWLTVECVRDTCIEGGLGLTDVERRRNLEVDTCPGFISDDYNRVEWVNEAYKRMMMMVKHHEGGSCDEQSSAPAPEPEIMVSLETKEKLSCAAFTSRVRVQYRYGGKEMCSRTVPCDTWRMDCGGFAWRLDVKAALSLGPC